MKSVPEQCAEIAALEDGWLDGEGKALSKEGLASFVEVWGKWGRWLNPFVAPAPNGNIFLEWDEKPHINTLAYSVEVDLISLKGELQIADLVTGQSHESNLDLCSERGWAALKAFTKFFLSL